MVKVAGWLLRVVIVVSLLGSVLVQLLVPVAASQVGANVPEVAYLVVPYSVAAILFVGCVQVSLVAVWRLLSMASDGTIFTRAALRWVDVITVCAGVATILSAAVMSQMLAFVPGGGGPMAYYIAICVGGALALMLLMIVMRSLLKSAIADRAELEAVI